jgi:hypothetical protein
MEKWKGGRNSRFANVRQAERAGTGRSNNIFFIYFFFYVLDIHHKISMRFFVWSAIPLKRFKKMPSKFRNEVQNKQTLKYVFKMSDKKLILKIVDPTIWVCGIGSRV